MAIGATVTLKAADGHTLDAYRAAPSGRAKGAIVLLQEIFGISDHIRRVCDEYAADGYLVVAPAFFDRIRRNMVLDYKQVAEGRDAIGKLSEAMVLADLNAGIAAAAEAGPVAAIGYCWGGAVAYLGACQADGLSGAVNYYGSRTIQLCERMTPRVPVMYHFGALDKSTPPEGIIKIKTAHVAGIYYVYEGADHGFNCEERSQFNPAAAKLARERTLEFLDDILQ